MRGHDSFTQEFAGESVDLPADQAKVIEPETAKAPVLEAPEPSELNQRGVTREEMQGSANPHLLAGVPRTQEACLMTEFQEARSAALGALNALLRSGASTDDIRLEVDATKVALESLLVLARGGSDA